MGGAVLEIKCGYLGNELQNYGKGDTTICPTECLDLGKGFEEFLQLLESLLRCTLGAGGLECPSPRSTWMPSLSLHI